jgi:hypothetical protein
MSTMFHASAKLELEGGAVTEPVVGSGLKIKAYLAD